MDRERERDRTGWDETPAAPKKDGWLSYIIKRRDKSLPPMTPAARRKRGSISPGTTELLEAGYRVPFVDTARGTALVVTMLYMIVYMVYNWFFRGTGFARFCAEIFEEETLKYWLFGFKCLFVFLSGISADYSRNLYKRAAVYAVGAVLVTAGSIVLYGAQNAVWFGYLHFLTAATLIYAFIRKRWDKVFDKVGLVYLLIPFLIMVLLTDKFTFDKLYLTLGQVRILIPYFITGFVHKGFSTPEFFGIFPWILLYFVGVVYGRYMRDGVIMENTYKFRVAGLDTIGRNALPIYLTFLPVCYGLLYLLDKLIMG